MGVDVVGIARLARARARTPGLLARVTVPVERVGVDDLRAAQLWAGKEAAAKTLGTGFWQAGVDWRDIRLDADDTVSLHGRARTLAGESFIALGFTHEEDRLIAVAFRWRRSTPSR